MRLDVTGRPSMTVKALEITIDIAVSKVRLRTLRHPPRWWARTCGLADQYFGNWHILRCPASPTHNWRLADGVAFYDPSRIANKNAAPSNDRRLSAKVFGPPSPCRTVAVSTGEAYPKQRRVSKSKAPKAFADGAEMSLRSIAISVPQRPAH